MESASGEAGQQPSCELESPHPSSGGGEGEVTMTKKRQREKETKEDSDSEDSASVEAAKSADKAEELAAADKFDKMEEALRIVGRRHVYTAALLRPLTPYLSQDTDLKSGAKSFLGVLREDFRHADEERRLAKWTTEDKLQEWETDPVWRNRYDNVAREIAYAMLSPAAYLRSTLGEDPLGIFESPAVDALESEVSESVAATDVLREMVAGVEERKQQHASNFRRVIAAARLTHDRTLEAAQHQLMRAVRAEDNKLWRPRARLAEALRRDRIATERREEEERMARLLERGRELVELAAQERATGVAGPPAT